MGRVIDRLARDVRPAYLAAVGWLEDWIAKWPAAKGKQITESVEADVVRLDICKFMVKREINTGGPEPPAKPRGIQFYNRKADQAVTGPACYRIQKACSATFRRHDVGDGIFVSFLSGMNANEIADLVDYERQFQPFWYERDGKRWDSTMGRSHHNLKMRFYRHLDPAFADNVEASYRTSTRVNGNDEVASTLRYVASGTTRSGHNDTTLGNCIINFGIAYEAMREQSLRGHIIVMGDDLLIAVYSDFNARRFANVESEMGIIPEYAKFADVEEVSILSGVFVPCGDKLAFIPKPGRLCARLWWTACAPHPKHVAAYKAGVRAGLACMLPFPILRVLLRGPAEGSSDRYREYADAVYNFTPGQVEEWFTRRYGIVADDWVRLERLIESCHDAPTLVVDDVMQRVIARDFMETADRPGAMRA